MQHTDTLKIYKLLLNGGFTESQAEAQINSMDISLDHVATRGDLLTLEKDLKIFFAYLVGGTVLLAILLPVFLKYVGVA